MSDSEQTEDWNVQTKKTKTGRTRISEKTEIVKKQNPLVSKKTTSEAPKHPLIRTLSFTCYMKLPGDSDNYNDSIKHIGDVDSVEEFWNFYSHLKRPCDVEFSTFFQYQLFGAGIQPLWDDKANLEGGKWMVKCKKEFSSRLWEDLVLAFVGDAFGLGEEITGVVISMRDEMPYDILNVWNKTASNQETRTKVRDAFVRVLKLQPGTLVEYKIHNERKENTQFKNSEVYKV